MNIGTIHNRTIAQTSGCNSHWTRLVLDGLLPHQCSSSTATGSSSSSSSSSISFICCCRILFLAGCGEDLPGGFGCHLEPQLVLWRGHHRRRNRIVCICIVELAVVFRSRNRNKRDDFRLGGIRGIAFLPYQSTIGSQTELKEDPRKFLVIAIA